MRLGPEDRDLLVFVSEQVAAAIAARRAAEALRERETLLRIAVEQLPAVLWTTDEELRFTSSVGAGLAALGLEPGPGRGHVGGCLRGGRTRSAPGSHRRALAGESVSFDVELAGRTFMLRVEPLHDSSSMVKGTVGIALDITEERRAAARLRQVIDLVPHFIFAKDAEGRFVLANRALAEAHGTTSRELLGKTGAELGTDSEEARRFVEDDLEVIRTGQRKVIPEERFTDAQRARAVPADDEDPVHVLRQPRRSSGWPSTSRSARPPRRRSGARPRRRASPSSPAGWPTTSTTSWPRSSGTSR